MADSDQRDADADENFVTNMKAAREALGWTQARLADQLIKAGVESLSQSAVSRIEKGERDVRLHEARAMATAFGTSLDSLSGPPSAFKEVLEWNAIRGRFSTQWKMAEKMVSQYTEARDALLDYLQDHTPAVSARYLSTLMDHAKYELRFTKPPEEPPF